MVNSQIYSTDHELNYREPSASEVKLCNELVKTIKAFGKKQRDSFFHLCIIAYGIRRTNLTKEKTRGGNQRDQKYKKEFETWYEQNDIKSVYGQLGNFTKYAMVGRLLQYTRWQLDKGEERIEQLPSTLTTLYLLSTIIWHQGESATDETRAIYRDLMITPVRDGSTDNAFICRSLTSKDVEKKIKQLEKEPKEKSVKLDDPRTIPLLKINIHEGLLQFNRKGTKHTIKGPDIDNVKALEKAIIKLVEEYGVENYSVDSDIKDIQEQYEDKKNPDFGKRIP